MPRRKLGKDVPLRRVRRLRNEQSASERLLWRSLRCDALGVRFRRQVPKGSYVLDFFAASIQLCVEVDGEQHDLDRDGRRDAALKAEGITTIRVPSADLWETRSREAWLETIADEIERRLSPP